MIGNSFPHLEKFHPKIQCEFWKLLQQWRARDLSYWHSSEGWESRTVSWLYMQWCQYSHSSQGATAGEWGGCWYWVLNFSSPGEEGELTGKCPASWSKHRDLNHWSDQRVEALCGYLLYIFHSPRWTRLEEENNCDGCFNSQIIMMDEDCGWRMVFMIHIWLNFRI